jgi:Putative zinc-finger
MGTRAVTGVAGCGDIRETLGVYLLGAIGPAERAAVDGHLAGCAGCREELAGLAALPGRLASMPVSDVTRMTLDTPAGRAGRWPPGGTLRPLVRAAALRRHLMWRRVAAAAGLAAAAVFTGGAVTASGGTYPPAPDPAAVAWQWPAAVHGSNPATGAAVTVRYRPQPWGVELRVQVSGIAPGTRCVVQVIGPGGREVAGGWVVRPAGAGSWYPASAPFSVSRVRGFAVSTAAGRALVSVPVR